MTPATQNIVSFRPSIASTLPWLAAMTYFMQTLDTTILNTALPAMAHDLHHSALALEATIISYAMTVALLTPLSGWFADRFGTKKVFMLSVSCFTLGSLCCALSPTLTTLILSRIIQGAGGALMVPVARLSLMRAYPRDELVKVISMVTLPALLGPVLGPLLGGWLVTIASWHWIFLINLPIGLAGITLGRQLMPDFKAPVAAFDWIGFVSFSLGLVMLSLGFELLSEPSFPKSLALTSISIGALLLVVYVWHAKRTPYPLFDLALFKSRSFSAGITGNILVRLGTGGIALLIPLMMQISFGESAQAAGWLLVPVALAGMASNLNLARIIKKYGFRHTLLTYTIATAIATAALAFITPTLPIWITLTLLAFFGATSTIIFVSTNTLAINDLPAPLVSQGNGALTIAQQLSLSFGIVCGSALLTLFHPTTVAHGLTLIPAFHYTYIALGVLTLLPLICFMTLNKTEGKNTAEVHLTAE